MEVKVTKKDVLFGYIAQIFNYGTGVIVLPVILSKLSAAEIGMNYVMLSVGALANMVDFGFAGQIGRNVTYVLSGAGKIFRGEVEQVEKNSCIDFKLLKTIIDASIFLYRRLSIVVLIILLSLGTLYMYHVTEGFSNVENSLTIWLLYSVSVFFNIYFLYYNSLLNGAGLVKEQKLATIYSRITYIAICFSLVFTGFGLMSVVIANLVAPFVSRYYSYRKFFSREMKMSLPDGKSELKEVKKALSDIWVTAKKSGTNTVGHYVGTQGSTFIAGAYLPLSITAQWGLMVQLFGVVQGLSMNMGMSYYPEYCKLRLQGDTETYIKKSSYSIAVMLTVMTVGGVSIIVLCPWLLQLIGSQTKIPSALLLISYLVYLIVLNNAQLFATQMSTRNVIPSPVAVISTSVAQLIITICFLQFTSLGIWSLLLGPAIAGISYSFWKWAQIELNFMQYTALRYYSIGFKELGLSLIKIINSFLK